jgi:DNA-binding NarL/FixJ family response regulator
MQSAAIVRWKNCRQYVERGMTSANSNTIIEQASAKTSSRRESRVAGARSEPTPARDRRRIRVLVVDEKGIMRDGLCALLAVMPDVEIVGSVAISVEAARSAASLRPTVIVIDFPPLPLKGPRLIAALRMQAPEAHVLVLSFNRENRLVEAALQAGAAGYVLKSDRRDDLFDALTSVAAGKRFLSPSVRGRVVRADGKVFDTQHTFKSATAELTDRERQVIRLIAAGRRTREIAADLSLSHKTIEKHRASLMRKLGLRNASAVAAYAIAHGLTEE